MGARLTRGLGRRDRETARLAVRASPLEPLAEDEMRGVAGICRRRVYRSARCASGPRRAARRLLRRRRSHLCRETRHRLRHEASVGSARRLDTITLEKSPFTTVKGLPRLRTHWVRPEIVVQVAFVEWTVHGKLRHPRLLGVRPSNDVNNVNDVKAARHITRGRGDRRGS